MIDILNVILPTFIVILIGYLLGKVWKINIGVIVDLIFYVGLPALVFTSMVDKKIVLVDAVRVWACSLTIILGCGLAGWVVFKLMRQTHSALHIPIAIMNTVNIPFPIISLAYGAEGLAAATLFYIPSTLLLFSVGVYIVSGKRWRDSLKEVYRVPAIYAAAAGLVVNLLNISVPTLVMKPLSLISPMVIPLVLLVLGCNLSTVRITSLPTTLIASFLRIGVGLALGFASVSLFHVTGIMRSVVILDSAMPAAANTAILAMKYNNESELISSVVFVTTVASLIVIPFLLSVLS
jgi:predicted permease